MSSRKRLTGEQIDAAAKRYESGEPANQLAIELGCGERTLRRHFSKRGVTAGGKRKATASGPPEGWEELLATIGRPPTDVDAWAKWARLALTSLACFQLENPELPAAYASAIEDYRDSIRSAATLRPEDLLLDARRLIVADSDDLEKPRHGPPSVRRSERRR